LVGSSTQAYNLDITASGLKGGLTLSSGANAGSGALTLTLDDTTGAVSTGNIAGKSVTVEKGALGTLATGTIIADTVTIDTTDALAAVTLSTGSDGVSSGTADITAKNVTIDGSELLATTADILATTAATSITASLDGGSAADLFSVTGNATVKTYTISGELGLGADKLFVSTAADYTGTSTDTVTINLDGVTKAGTTDTQTAVLIDVSATEAVDISVTGSKGSNDTVEFGTHTSLSDIDITLSGVEKITFDDGAAFKAAALSGQTIAMTGSGAGATATLTGLDIADTVDTSNLTAGANADLAIDMGQGDDTITLGAMVEALSYTTGADGMDTITGFTTASDTWTTDFAATTSFGAGVTADAAAANGAVTLATNADAIFEITGTLQAAITDYTDGAQVLAAISGTSVSVTADTNKAIIVVYDNSNAYVYEAVEGADAGDAALAGDDLTLVATFVDITAGSLAHGDIVVA
jgi:hypothetical protein